jgi:hypothetical protein
VVLSLKKKHRDNFSFTFTFFTTWQRQAVCYYTSAECFWHEGTSVLSTQNATDNAACGAGTVHFVM